MTDQELKDLVAGLAVSHANYEARQAAAETRQAEAEARQAAAQAAAETRQAEAEARQTAAQAAAETRQAEAEARQAAAQAAAETRQAEAEARQAAAEARQANYEAQQAAAQAAAEARKVEADARQAKNDAQIAKTEALVRKITQQYGNYINNQSRRAEEFFIKGIKKLDLRVAGIQFDDIFPNLIRQRRHSGIELDALLTNGEVVAILEVKTRLHGNDVDAVYHKRIPAFRQFFREYRDKSLLVLVGGLSVNGDALAKAHEYGFICLQADNQQLAVDASCSRRFEPSTN